MVEQGNLTPLRRRILSALEQRGEMDIQEIGFEFATSKTGRETPFKHPASATRFGGMLVAPLRRASWVKTGVETFGYRHKIAIAPDGKAKLREDTNV